MYLHAQFFGVVEFRRQAVVVEVAAGNTHPVVDDHAAQLLRRMRVHVPVGLDFVVADHADVGQDGIQVLLRLLAHGVELHTHGKWLDGGECQVRERQRAAVRRQITAGNRVL